MSQQAQQRSGRPGRAALFIEGAAPLSGRKAEAPVLEESVRRGSRAAETGKACHASFAWRVLSMWRVASFLRREARDVGSPHGLLSTCWLDDFAQVDGRGWSAQRGEVGRPVLPQATEGAAQSRERQLSSATMTARAMSEIVQQPEP